MKNKRLVFLVARLTGALVLTNCDSSTAEDVVSTVEKHECFICGDWSDTIMESVGNNASIGLVYLNEPTIIDTKVRAYDDDGHELFKQGTVSYRSAYFGEGKGHAWMTCLSDRGITDIKIDFKERDAVDLKHASKTLCQQCLDVVEYSVRENNVYGKKGSSGATGFYLLDFRTRKLYGLSEPFHRQYMGDYYASFACVKAVNEDEEGTIELMVFYAPEREPLF